MAEQDSRSVQAKLAEAESIIEALRAGKIDAVVGQEQVAVLRLREIEEELRRSEARYRGVVEDLADLVYRWNEEGKLTFVNQAFCGFLSQSREDLEGTSVSAALPSATDFREIWAELAASTDAERPSLDCEERVPTPGGDSRWLSITHRLLYKDDGETEIQSVARDITERRQAQEQLRELNEDLERRVEERTAQLESLVRELEEAEQRERRRLAQYLHDDLQQLLVASKLNLKTAREQANSDAQTSAVDRANNLLDRSLTASRSLVSQLNPPELQNAGFLSALSWLGGQMQELHGMHVEVDGDPQAEPQTTHLRDMLFSFARELLFNSIKHAGASQIWLETRRRSGGQIEIQVRDDGQGFDAAGWSRTQRRETGLGLWRIKERLQLLGGRLDLDSAPGQGACITLTAPASADEGA